MVVQHVVLTSVYRWQLYVRHSAIWQITLKLNRFEGEMAGRTNNRQEARGGTAGAKKSDRREIIPR